jgi:hypothetical protein
VVFIQPVCAEERDDHSNHVLILAIMAAVDYDQSTEAFFERSGYTELNPLLGSRPSRGGLAAFGIIGIAATYILSETDHPLSQLAVDSIIASEQFNIEENARLLDGQKRRINGIPIILSFRF